MDILEALVHDAPVVGGEHLHLEALGLQNPGHEPEVNRQHGGEEDGVLLLHLLGEEKAAGFVVYQFCHRNWILSLEVQGNGRNAAYRGLAHTSAQAGRKPAFRAVFREKIWLWAVP